MNGNNTARNTVALCLALVATAALATDPAIPDRGPVPFDVYDTNGDGYIEQDEFGRIREQRVQQRVEQQRMMRNMGNAPDFADLDSDGDGRISREEMQIHQQQRQQQRGNMRNPNAPAGPGGMGGTGQ